MTQSCDVLRHKPRPYSRTKRTHSKPIGTHQANSCSQSSQNTILFANVGSRKEAVRQSLIIFRFVASFSQVELKLFNFYSYPIELVLTFLSLIVTDISIFKFENNDVEIQFNHLLSICWGVSQLWRREEGKGKVRDDHWDRSGNNVFMVNSLFLIN